jgi:signal transduction histidine kinase/ligand-binding sensor domain-containing protein
LWSDAGQVIFLDASGRLLCGRRTPADWSWQWVDLPRGSEAPPAQICADSTGRIWFLRNNSEIAWWQDGRWQMLHSPPGLAGQKIRVLVADAQRRIWAGTDRMLAQWQDDRFVPVQPGEDGEILDVRRIIPAGNSLWVEANHRLRRLVNQRWVAESPGWNETYGRRVRFNFIQGGHKGGLWAGARDLGLIHVASDGTLDRLTTVDGLPSDTLHFVFTDREDNLWTGYDRGGLVQVRPRLFHSIGRAQGLTETLVNSVSVDPQGGAWVGTHGGEVFRVENGRCASVPLPHGVGEGISVVSADSRGRVWIGTATDGLMLYTNGQAQVLIKPEDLRRAIRLLFPARDGRLWIATGDAVWTLTGDQLKLVYQTPTTSAYGRNYLASIGETPEGTIWVGTFDGILLRFQGDQVERIEPPDYRQLGRLWSLCPTATGGLWIGTSKGGLLRYEQGKFLRYTTERGLPSDCIAQVLTDARGNLWLGTSVGIVRIAEGMLSLLDRGEVPTLPYSLYGKPDGLMTIGSSIEFQPNCGRAPDGKLWFAMVNSVAWVAPDEVAQNPNPPGLVMEMVRADGGSVWPATPGEIFAVGGNPVQPATLAPDKPLRLGPGRQDVEFDFTALSFDSPAGVRFRYRLAGLDAKWTDNLTERRAIYRALPPGKYTFRLRGCNRDGLWNENELQFGVVVLPHYWQTTWFAAALAGLAGLTVAAAIALPLRARHRRRLRLQFEQLERQRAVERERTRVAQDLHDDLGAGLTEISLLAGMLRSEQPALPAERRQQAIGRIVQRARYLVTALDEIVWAMNPRHDSARSLGGYFCRYAQEFFESTPMRCRLDFREGAQDSPLNSEQRHNLFLAFKETLTNVARHSGATEVRVTVSLETPGRLEILVQDNGRGLPLAREESAEGLALLQQRMERLGGVCTVSNLAAGGVEVRLSVPLASAGESPAGQPSDL